MPIQVPPGASIVTDNRLTLIRVISTLYERLVDSDGSMKSKVKQTMLDKQASFAESDLVIAALRAGSSRSTIDARKLYGLVKSGRLKLTQFLECVSVVQKPLKTYLTGEEITKLSTVGPAAEPSLVTEFKEGVQLDVDELAMTLAGAISKAVPIKSQSPQKQPAQG
jgi:hypothetical protein